MLLQRYPLSVCITIDTYRQRHVKLGGGAKMSVFSVAQKYLPGELLGRVRMVKPGVRKRRTRRVRQQSHDDEE